MSVLPLGSLTPSHSILSRRRRSLHLSLILTTFRYILTTLTIKEVLGSSVYCPHPRVTWTLQRTFLKGLYCLSILLLSILSS